MSDSPELVVVATFTSVHEAQLAQSVIAAAGIEVVLDNEHIVTMNWGFSNAVGGVKVVTLRDRREEARELLDIAAVVDDRDRPPFPPLAAGDVCGNCGNDSFDSVVPYKALLVITFLMIGVPIGSLRRRRFCRRCGARPS